MQATIHNEFLTLTVDTNVRLAAGATIELWGVPACAGAPKPFPTELSVKFLSLSMKFLCFVLMHLPYFVILVKKRKVGNRPWMSLFGLSIRSSTIPC